MLGRSSGRGPSAQTMPLTSLQWSVSFVIHLLGTVLPESPGMPCPPHAPPSAQHTPCGGHTCASPLAALLPFPWTKGNPEGILSGNLQRNQNKVLLSLLLLNPNRSKFLIKELDIKLSQVQNQQGHAQIRKDLENEHPSPRQPEEIYQCTHKMPVNQDWQSQSMYKVSPGID